MGSITENALAVKNASDAIDAALVAKGAESTGHDLTKVAAKIGGIEVRKPYDIPRVVDEYGRIKLNSLGKTGISAAGVKSITRVFCYSYAFSYLSDLESVSFPDLRVVDSNACFSSMLKGCRSLAGVAFPKLRAVGYSSVNGADDPATEDENEFVPASSGRTAACTKVFEQMCAVAGGQPPIDELRFPELVAIYSGATSAANAHFYAVGGTIKKLYLPKLKYIEFANNVVRYDLFNASSLTDIYVDSLPASAIRPFTYSNATTPEQLLGAPQSVVFHCSDGDVAWDGGQWAHT